jgi:hypothetical protein
MSFKWAKKGNEVIQALVTKSKAVTDVLLAPICAIRIPVSLP